MRSLHSIRGPGTGPAGSRLGAGASLVLLFAVMGAGPGLSRAQSAPAATSPIRSVEAPPSLRSFAAEAREIRGRLRSRLVDLEARLARRPDPAAQREITAAIEIAKLDAEIEMFGLQARRARSAGHTRLTAKVESAIATLVDQRDRLARARALPAGNAGSR